MPTDKMKLEVAESLFYSWLRHVKDCHVVQTNWKPSPLWQLHNEYMLKQFMEMTDSHFQDKYGYGIFKSNSLSQLLMQAEADVVGICMTDNEVEIHAIDVAFHESGLNYGGKQETVTRIVKKLIRTVLCIIGYFVFSKGEIIFASPKIHNSVMDDLSPCVNDLNKLLRDNHYPLSTRIIANESFYDLVLTPIIIASDGVSDTSELFMRSYQLVKMFGDDKPTRQRVVNQTNNNFVSNDTLSELKVGKIAQTFLRDALEDGNVSDNEVSLMQTKNYSKSVFGIDYPLIVKLDDDYDSVRYYSKPLTVNGKQYRLCSQWFEVSANNDKPFLLAWLKEHNIIIP